MRELSIHVFVFINFPPGLYGDLIKDDHKMSLSDFLLVNSKWQEDWE